MPRIGSVILANYPHHIVQREHNKQVVFAAPRDYECHLETLGEFKSVFDIKVYAFCLMTHHIHLLMAPGLADGLSIDLPDGR